MSLDVVIVTYNSAARIGAAIRPLPDDATVIVVDNASTDASAARAAELGATVVVGEVNAGFAAAANRGAALGDGEHILFLNPDAVIEADQLAVMVAAVAADERVAVVAPRVRQPDGQPQQVRWPYPSSAGTWREALGLGRRRRRRVTVGADDGDGFVIGACFLVRRSAFAAVGGFDARYWLYGEETDLCARLADRGGRIVTVPDAVADHAGGASAEGIEDLVFEHFQRGAEHFVARREGRRGLLRLRLGVVVGAAIRSIALGPPGRDHHRRRLHRTLAVLRRHPTTVALDSPATRAPGRGLVICSLEGWDDVWRRNQFLVRELLARDPDLRIVFVEPPFDWRHELVRRDRAASPAARRVRQPGLRPLDGDGRVVRFEPGKWWPRRLGPLADASLRRQVRGAAAAVGFEDPTLWVNDPGYAGLARATGWPALYDVTDDWTEAGAPDRIRRRVRRQEEVLVDEVGAVVVCSPGLATSHRDARPDLVVVPNAVDAELFTRPAPRPPDLPEGSTAVYVGTLHEDRLDVGIVAALADHRRDLHVMLVGPDALSPVSRVELDRRGNVHRLGPRRYQDVPGYLQHASVVIVPHVVTPFTESLDPIKAYECLAVGRPTIATPVAGFRDAGPPVVIAGAGEFSAAVDAALAADAPADPRPVPSWAQRADEFAAALARARDDAGAPRRRPRVVYLDHCARLSGAEIALARLLAAGPDVEAHVILGERGPLEGRLHELGVTVEVLEMDPEVAEVRRGAVTAGGLGLARATRAARDIERLRRRLVELRPDLVHTNSLKAAVWGGVAGRLAGVPVLWHLRDRIAPDYLPAAAVRLVRTMARTIPAQIVANSAATLATVGGPTAGVVVHDMVPPVAFREASAAEGDRPFRVAMVGRLAPWKGQDLLIAAFAGAFPAGAGGRGAEAVIVGSALFGEDEYAKGLPALAAELGVGERVHFRGFVEDVGGELARADCLVHASRIAEPFGQVVVEGMAAGVAVVAVDLGGPREVVHDGVDGLLFPVDDVDALAERLSRLAADPELAARLVVAGRERARDFAPAAIVPRYDEIYRGLLARRGRRGAASKPS